MLQWFVNLYDWFYIINDNQITTYDRIDSVVSKIEAINDHRYYFNQYTPDSGIYTLLKELEQDATQISMTVFKDRDKKDWDSLTSGKEDFKKLKKAIEKQMGNDVGVLIVSTRDFKEEIEQWEKDYDEDVFTWRLIKNQPITMGINYMIINYGEGKDSLWLGGGAAAGTGLNIYQTTNKEIINDYKVRFRKLVTLCSSRRVPKG